MRDLSSSASSDLLNETLEGLKRTSGLAPGDRVVAAMSGGIDSSVMAVLLHMAGFDVVGVSMQLFKKTEFNQAEGKCCTLDDFQDARRISHQFGFRHYVMNFEERFKAEVMDPFVASYLKGETPSPCILCNQHLKFDSLLRSADEIQAQFVATGHYARITRDSLGFRLFKATDKAKDQSYFLFSHTQSTLARTLFPLEGLSKGQVRQIARTLGLAIAEKPESQEICFVSQDRYDRFIESNGAPLNHGEGPIRHVNGKTLGTHQGFWRFTVGQRKGIGVAHPRPLYVIRTEPETNTVWVGEDEFLLEPGLEASKVSWCRPVSGPLVPCAVKLRSRSAEVPAVVEIQDDHRVKVRFETPQRAVTPGQAVVFYQGEEVLGGGWIRRPVS